MHRDIKPENILLLVDENGQINDVKLADFGMVCQIGSQRADDEFGTSGYQAPEYLNRNPYDEKCDSFSIGVLLYNFITGKMPFHHKYRHKLDYMVKFKQAKYNDKAWKQCSPEAKALTMGLLEKDLAKRLTIKDILDHPWLQ